MESKADQASLIVIVGETATGKSALALELAKRCNGEIISADSRTLYRGMDIGTAKPSSAEQKEIQHYLIDVTTPDHPITVAYFKTLANRAIEQIAGKGKLPIMVGGTGLYVDSVIYDYSFAGKADNDLRTYLQTLTVEQLQQKLQDAGIDLPRNKRNARHLIRQFETGGNVGERRSMLRDRTLVLGISRERADLEARVTKRIDAMLAAGLEVEAHGLAGQYGWDNRAMQTIGYQEFRGYFEGMSTLNEVREQVIRNTMQYAKRQRTWFRRNKDIHWICKAEEAIDLVTTFMNK